MDRSLTAEQKERWIQDPYIRIDAVPREGLPTMQRAWESAR